MRRQHMTVQKLKHGLLAAAIILGSGAALANDLSELGKSLTPIYDAASL